jgi:hypothetical protein
VYGTWFRTAGLEPVRHVGMGASLTRGLEGVTVRAKLAEAHPGDIFRPTWAPPKGGLCLKSFGGLEQLLRTVEKVIPGGAEREDLEI